jgi:hypothetical protein
LELDHPLWHLNKSHKGQVSWPPLRVLSLQRSVWLMSTPTLKKFLEIGFFRFPLKQPPKYL